LHPDRHRASPGESGEAAAAAHRGAVRSLSRRRRHRARYGQLRPGLSRSVTTMFHDLQGPGARYAGARLLTQGDAMSAQEPIAFLRRRGFFIALFALAACDSDTTPIVQDTADGTGERLNFAPTNGPGGTRSASTRDPGYKLGPNDRVRIIVFGQPTLTGEFTVDGNGTMSYPLIGNITAGGMTVAELQQTITRKLEPDYLVNPSV